MKEKIEELLREQEKKLAELLRPNRYVHKAPENPFRLKKLDLFGQPVHMRRIEFEWPTDKIFELMPDKETLCIEKIHMKASPEGKLISMRCELTNGMKSPTFKSLMDKSDDDKITEASLELNKAE